MRLIDEQYLKTPTWGSRSMRNHLRRLGYKINRKHVQRLMRLMGLEAIYPRLKPAGHIAEHKVYPYLLRNLNIERPNQVWCADITYLPMRRGFMYLVAIMDWHSRKVLSWRQSPMERLLMRGVASGLRDVTSESSTPVKIPFTNEVSSAFKDHDMPSADGRFSARTTVLIGLWWTLKITD